MFLATPLFSVEIRHRRLHSVPCRLLPFVLCLSETLIELCHSAPGLRPTVSPDPLSAGESDSTQLANEHNSPAHGATRTEEAVQERRLQIRTE